MTSLLESLIVVFLRQGLEPVERFLAGTPLQDGESEFFRTLITYANCRMGLAEMAPTYERICRLIDAPPASLSASILLMCFQLDIALWTDRLSDAQRSYHRLVQMQDEQLLPEVVAEAAIARARFQGLTGGPHYALDTLSRVMHLPLERGSRAWYRVKHHHAQYAQRLVNFDLTQADLQELAPFEQRYPDLMPLDCIWTWVCNGTGRLEKALWHADRIPLRNTHLRSTTANYKAAALIQMRRFDEAHALMDQAQAQQPPLIDENDAALLHAIESLVNRRFDEARTTLLRLLDKCDIRGRDQPLWLLLQADLSNLQASAAERTLRMMDPRQDRPDLLVEWARLFLLQQDRKKATDCIAHAVNTFKPTAALIAKLRFAYELSAFDFETLRQQIQDEAHGPAPAQLYSRPPISRTPSAEPVFVGQSKAATAIREKIKQFAPLQTSVLISGETGTGKEVVARLLHTLSDRAKEPFVPVNCGGISETLVESELFGHVRGAFTGAVRDHPGIFLAAGKGTVFLDEINVMSSRLQNILMRVLENGEIRPIGSNVTHRTAARVVAASNQPLEKAVQEGRFLQDLYFRLLRLHIHIPPLRERPEDIVAVAGHYLRRLFEKGEALTIERDLLDALAQRDWPGNVRELQNELERIVLRAGQSHRLSVDLLEAHSPRTATSAEAPSEGRYEPTRPPDKKTASSPPQDDYEHKRMLSTQHTLSRRRKLLELFSKYQRLTRGEIMDLLGCAPKTATMDLMALQQEGAIRRVQTSGHLRTSYFVLVRRFAEIDMPD